MIFENPEGRRIVSSRPGQGTGETIETDNLGRSYREVSEAEAQMIEQGTCGRVYRIYPNGSVS